MFDRRAAARPGALGLAAGVAAGLLGVGSLAGCSDTGRTEAATLAATRPASP